MTFGVVATASAIVGAELELDRPVIDQARLLSGADRAEIERQLRQWRRQGVIQAAVVLVDDTEDQAIFDYGMALVARWKLGDEKSDNGLLMLIARDEREFFIFTGDGLEGALPDISLKRIERNQLLPAFKRGDFAGGIKNTLQTIVTQIEADPQTRADMIAADAPAHGRGRQIPGALPPILAMLFFTTLVLRAVFGMMRGTLIGSVGFFASLFLFLGVEVFPALVFAFFFFVASSMICGIFAGGRGIATRGRTYGGSRSRGFSAGDGFSGGGFSGGGGGFSGGGAGGSW